MKGFLEFTGFLGVSVAAHLALWSGADDGASASAGAGGASVITLTGGTPTLAALVAEWDTPPVALTEPMEVTMPVPDDAAPALAPPATETAEPMRSASPVAPVIPGAIPVAPKVDLIPPPAPRATLAPEASSRPKPRPETAKPAPRAVAKPKPDTAPKPKPKVKRAAPAKQTAAGTGGKKAAGKTRTPGTGATKAAKPSASQMARWGGSIRSRVERRNRYPSGTSGRGKVGLWLKVTTTGQLIGAGISQSSGNAAFDRAALSAVRRAALPRAPKGVAQGAYRFTLSMEFSR